jgi:hypothetical protein
MLGLPTTAVCCRECDPPTRVEIPARVFYRLKDHDLVSCPNGHRGSLAEYKLAATGAAEPQGPFMSFPDYPARVPQASRGG